MGGDRQGRSQTSWLIFHPAVDRTDGIMKQRYR